MQNNQDKAFRIQIKGLVQGVGFRPFVFILAKEKGIKGWVENRNDGVVIHAEANEKEINSFTGSIISKAPLASSISEIIKTETDFKNYNDFQIVKSSSISEEITEISPDISVCGQCLNDLRHQQHRIDYPFINCTHCGPRFTIIEDLPYDREKTSMKEFLMCPVCEQEYKDVYDRRFHAQPVACNNCGPEYSLHSNEIIISEVLEILEKAADLLDNHEIIAIKGMGGYNLSCNALSNLAVNKLRAVKKREQKPFAVMFRNPDAVKNYAFVSPAEEKSLLSWRKPIVLLTLKNKLAEGVSNGLNSVGVMLPYLPVHYLLFNKLKTDAIVLTSGNFSDEPIIINDEEAIKSFSDKTSAVIVNNREIVNRTDDSVVFIVNESERIIRRSRGYVPNPVLLKFNVEGVFAAGAELTNCFAIGKGQQAILSQHIGDLQNFETYTFYTESIESFSKMFRFKPEIAVCDLHPDYLSTRFVQHMKVPVVEIQHHHAHITSVMAEYGLDEKVTGIAFDGTGLGSDGHIWGGEFLICDLKDFERYAHFAYLPVPGGDKAAYEPWRTAFSLLRKVYGDKTFDLPIAFIQNLNQQKAVTINEMLINNVNCPLSSSAGRLFDAVAALTNICTVAGFHAEAPMRLESAIQKCDEKYDFEFYDCSINFLPAAEQIVNDLIKKVPSGIISAKFHNTIVDVCVITAQKIRKDTKINKIVLSGGSFQNRYLLEKTEEKLLINKFDVFSPRKIPCNDAGIALGQLVSARKKL